MPLLGVLLAATAPGACPPDEEWQEGIDGLLTGAELHAFLQVREGEGEGQLQPWL